MKILGLGGSSHDFSACIVENGKLLVSIEEERITRVKHSIDMGIKNFRARAVDYCLNATNLKIEDIDYIITNDLIDPIYYSKYKSRITLMNHHLSHAASAYYPSNFEDAAILIMDGYGSCLDKEQSIHETISFYHGKNQNIQELKKFSGRLDRTQSQRLFENSLGMFYLTVTLGIGFEFLQEGKTMGLAPYGTDRYVEKFYDFYTFTEDNSFIYSRDNNEELKKFIANELVKENNSFQTKADLAYAAQYHLEKIVVALCNYLYRLTKTKNLCLAGGVALNSVANFKILNETPFEHIFIQPSAGDAGTAIGSALYKYYSLKPKEKKNSLFDPYLGKEYDDKEIERVIEKNVDKLIVKKSNNIHEEVAKLLSDEQIIGLFHGRSEIGPRALGNRSILANPKNPDMKNIINERIKHREPFRPFAPIVLEEWQEEYFEMKHPSYYMLLVPSVIKEKIQEIPSVSHFDGTGRVQTINKSINSNMYAILSEFKKLTGTPVLLNTSFNDNGEPIVETPEDAINCFLNIDLDHLIIGEYILSKK